MKRAAVDELRSEEVARLSPLGRLRADSHEIDEGSQRDIHRSIELTDEPPPRSQDKEEVLTPIKNTDDDCSSLFDSQSPDVLEGGCDRLWWHSNTWQHLEERRKDWLSNRQSFKPATANDLMSSLNPHLCKFCRVFFDDVWKVSSTTFTLHWLFTYLICSPFPSIHSSLLMKSLERSLFLLYFT
jgi:hypothetical protein